MTLKTAVSDGMLNPLMQSQKIMAVNSNMVQTQSIRPRRRKHLVQKNIFYSWGSYGFICKSTHTNTVIRRLEVYSSPCQWQKIIQIFKLPYNA